VNDYYARHDQTDETRAKISAALKGRFLAPDHRANLSAARRGAVPPHGTRARRKRGCECDRCREAYNAYMREYYARRRKAAS
jgi:hypothetical protein